MTAEPLQMYGPVPEDLETLIVAFAGWSDAGGAATYAVKYLAEKRSSQRLAAVDPEEFYDFTNTRPLVKADATGHREIAWPTNEFFAAPAIAAAPGLLLLSAVEPNLKWRTFTRVVMELAQRCNVQKVVVLGALLDSVPHSRPARITGTSTLPEIRVSMEARGIRSSSYQGPTGISSALIEVCQERGLPFASFWGHAPHYVQASPNPLVSYALLEALRDTMGIQVEMKEIGQQAIAFREWCNKAVAEEAAMQSYIQRLERHYDEAVQILGKPSEFLPESPSEDMPNPQELVADLEDFLRRQSRNQ